MNSKLEEPMRGFVSEASAADADMDKTGEAYRADEVHAWMTQLAAGEVICRPSPR